MVAAISPDSMPAMPNGWECTKLLDRGAFAMVFEGKSPKGERVAIKIPVGEHPQTMPRFLREIKVLSALPKSKNVVAYKGEGDTADGTRFLAMEYVDGFTLTAVFDTGRQLTEAAVCELMVQLCKSFAGLHKLGLSHGDIKPRNIMLTRGNMVVKLLDFGLVRDSQGLLKLFEEEAILQGRDFEVDIDAGLLRGTPEYLAPEQIADARVHDPEKLQSDTPADVFGLGVIFFQLLTGRRPWPFKPEAKTREEYVKQAKLYLEARLALDTDRVERPIEINPMLWSIIAKAMRQNPKQRPGRRPREGQGQRALPAVRHRHPHGRPRLRHRHDPPLRPADAQAKADDPGTQDVPVGSGRRHRDRRAALRAPALPISS